MRDSSRDAVGQLAGGILDTLANRVRATAASAHGVAMMLEGTRSLGGDASAAAARRGRRSHPGWRHCRSGWDGQDSAQHFTGAHRQGRLQIRAVLDEADKVNSRSAQGLDKLAGTIGRTDHKQVLGQEQAEAALNKLDVTREGLPDSTDAVENRKWWDSLSPQQRTDLERAVRVALHDPPGIPQEVRDRLVGTDRYNRVDAVRWAENNWNNPDVNLFGNNCAHFVSTALEQSGLTIYFQNATGNQEFYHAALVTSVTPDGDVYYTNDRLNLSLKGRLPQNELQYGDMTTHIIRLGPKW